MDTQAHRKLRLRELIDHSCDGFISVMAAKIGKADSYVSRMLYSVDKKGTKPVGDKAMLDIEAAFGLERAWLDKPLGYGFPDSQQDRLPKPATGGDAHKASDRGAAPEPKAVAIVWPFKIVGYLRLQALQQALGAKLGHEAIRDIDKHLEIVTLKWEREAELAVKRRAA